jgi:diadenosine tetraphosphate (Ap4A) HIT family hydrolase
VPFVLDPRLARDGPSLGDLPLCRVILLDAAACPWLVLVPRREGPGQSFDLPPEDRLALAEEVRVAAAVLRRLYAPARINVADIGNVCPQLHVHVVARFADDPCWPGVVWGRPLEPCAPGALSRRAEELRAALGVEAPAFVCHRGPAAATEGEG